MIYVDCALSTLARPGVSETAAVSTSAKDTIDLTLSIVETVYNELAGEALENYLESEKNSLKYSSQTHASRMQLELAAAGAGEAATCEVLYCAGVVEWQTRRTQNPVGATLCGFKSHLRHHCIETYLEPSPRVSRLACKHPLPLLSIYPSEYEPARAMQSVSGG